MKTLEIGKNETYELELHWVTQLGEPARPMILAPGTRPNWRIETPADGILTILDPYVDPSNKVKIQSNDKAGMARVIVSGFYDMPRPGASCDFAQIDIYVLGDPDHADIRAVKVG
jgi:hypothetical protein